MITLYEVPFFCAMLSGGVAVYTIAETSDVFTKGTCLIFAIGTLLTEILVYALVYGLIALQGTI